MDKIKILALSGDSTFNLGTIDGVEIKTEVEITGGSSYRCINAAKKIKVAEEVKLYG